MPGISRWSPGILPVYEHFHNYFHYIRKRAASQGGSFQNFTPVPVGPYSAESLLSPAQSQRIASKKSEPQTERNEKGGTLAPPSCQHPVNIRSFSS